jgi:hypothetical protein
LIRTVIDTDGDFVNRMVRTTFAVQDRLRFDASEA